MAHGGRVQTLREGTWLYDGSVPCCARLVREDWDEDFVPAGDPQDEPESYRTAYYLEYEVVGSSGRFGSISGFHRTEAEAAAEASELLPTLKWRGLAKT